MIVALDKMSEQMHVSDLVPSYQKTLFTDFFIPTST